MSSNDMIPISPICKKVRGRLPEFAAGILASRAKEAVERHCADCEVCAGELAALRGVVQNIQNMAAAEARSVSKPADVVTMIQKAESSAQGTAPKSSWWRTLLRFAPMAAAIFLASVFGGICYQSNLEQKGLREEINHLNKKVARLEEAAPAIVESTKRAVLPALRDLAGEIDARDGRFEQSLQILARYVDERRAADSRVIAGELADTREYLQVTQDAVLRVAQRLRE